MTAPPAWPDEARRTKSLYRYQAAVRAHLSVRAYDETAERLVADTTREAAETMSDPADLINRAVEVLQAAAIDLPAFSTLDRLVNSVRAKVHARIYDQVKQRLTADHKSTLDGLLTKPPNSVTTSFNRLKQTPGPATPKTIRLWIERLEWLIGLIDPEPLLEGVAHTKLRQFASEAAALEVNELLDVARPGKRHTLLLSLLRQARMRCRDELIEMMLRRIRRTQAAAEERLEALHDQHREIEEALIGIFGQVLSVKTAADRHALTHRSSPASTRWQTSGPATVSSRRSPLPTLRTRLLAPSETGTLSRPASAGRHSFRARRSFLLNFIDATRRTRRSNPARVLAFRPASRGKKPAERAQTPD